MNFNTIKLVFANMIRKTPPKFIIGLNFLIMFVFVIPKGKMIKNGTKNYTFKEVDNRRKFVLEQVLYHSNKK